MAFHKGQPYVVGNSDQTEVEVYAFDPHPRVVGSIHDWVDKRRNKEHVDHVFPPFWRLWMLIMLTHTRLYTRFESGKELFRVLNIYKLNWMAKRCKIICLSSLRCKIELNIKIQKLMLCSHVIEDSEIAYRVHNSNSISREPSDRTRL